MGVEEASNDPRATQDNIYYETKVLCTNPSSFNGLSGVISLSRIKSCDKLRSYHTLI